MSDNATLTRRSVLRLGGDLGVGGVALATGLAHNGTSAFAADRKLPTAKIVTGSSSVSLVLDALLQQEGFFTQMGVEVSSSLNVTDGNKAIAALVGGSADMCGSAGFSGLFPAIEKGAKIKILSGTGLRPITAVFSKRPDIQTVKDLEGKTYGSAAPGSLLHELALGLMIKKGVDYTKVTFVNIGSAPDIFRAVAAGTVDAGPGEIDFYIQRAKYGVHALSDGLMWDELPEYTNQAMFATDETIAAKRDILVRCMAAYATLFRFVQKPESKDAWRKARATVVGKDEPAEAAAQWEFFSKPNILAANLEMDQARTDYIQQLNMRLGLQKSILPLDRVADLTLARDALRMII